MFETKATACAVKNVKDQQKSPNSELLGLFDLAEWTGLIVNKEKPRNPTV
jgi:hypothetical protein